MKNDHSILTGEDKAMFTLKLLKCPVCKKRMIHKHEKLFFDFYPYRQKDQAENIGVRLESSISYNGEKICEECAKGGKSTFQCYSCEKHFLTSDIKEHFGGKFLCKNCYDTLPAKRWDELYNEILKYE